MENFTGWAASLLNTSPVPGGIREIAFQIILVTERLKTSSMAWPDGVFKANRRHRGAAGFQYRPDF
jgi:hypothetical protein